jgi:hypothetical protein
MIALTCDFHFLAARVTASFSAVLFAIRHVAQARYVRTLSSLLIRHYNSILFQIYSSSPRTTILDVASADPDEPEEFLEIVLLLEATSAW